MSWSSDFLAALGNGVQAPLFRLERLQVYLEPGSPYSVASLPQLGTDDRASIGRGGVQVQGQTLSPRGPWSATIGAFSVEIVGSAYNLRRALTKGTIVGLHCGLPSSPGLYVWERIAVGQVTNLRWAGGRYTLECRDFLSALPTRLNTDYTWSTLFYALHSTTLTANEAVASGTYDVVGSAAAWGKETGGLGALRVTPTSGDPYFRLYSATTATTITISAPGTATVMDTTDVGATSGDVVDEVAYLQGHPIDVLRKVLASKDGTNGAYDLLPAHCGLAIADELLDHVDMDNWKALVVKVASGAYTWQLAVDTVVDDAIAWLADIISSSGLFLAMRQGQLTVRAAQLVSAAAYPGDFEITDADIIEVISFEVFEPGFSVEAEILYVTSPDGTTSSSGGEPATLPAVDILTVDISAAVHTNESAVRTEVAGRLVESVTKVAARLVLRLATLRAAQITVGDVVILTTSQVEGDDAGFSGYNRRPVLVDECNPGWMLNTVDVGLLIYPLTTETFP